MIYACCNLDRKSAVLNNLTLNGIDYLEVLDNEVVTLGLDLTRQETLLIHCLKPLPHPLTITNDNILITGGESITGITAAWVAAASAPPSTLNAQTQDYFTSLPDAKNVLIVGTSAAGDFSTYTLRLVNDAATASQDTFALTAALDGFDPHLTAVQFSFKVECGPDFDCNPQSSCTPTLQPPPPINYLAKDYGSFRSIMLDRLNQLLPAWGATSEADYGIALAELIAYAGDQLSYRQDATATEAYIETARSRISLRRHALLVDYHVHDGCNARAWIQVQVEGITGEQIFLDRTTTNFYTRVPGPTPGTPFTLTPTNQEAALIAGVQVFEPMCDAVLYPENAQMYFYTWGNNNCCLPEGATEATLLGTYLNLNAGDILIFEEVKGPQTGNPADADMRHRCAVRLTAVATQDANGKTLVDPLFESGTGNPILVPGQQPTAITEIQWSIDDALPFPVCISSTYLDDNSDKQTVTNVSVALGNIVLADQGLSFTATSLKSVPNPTIYYPPNTANRCNPTQPTPVPPRYSPQIPDSPITQAVPVSVVALPGSGNPVTNGVLPLSGAGFVALPDASGFISLTLQNTNPASWPSLFGVLVKPNTANPANIDISVVYNPPGGAAGLYKQIAVEQFLSLSLNPASPSYAVKQINANSQLIQVQAPPAAAPAGFPSAPTMLSNTGPVNLQDTSPVPVTYLTAQPTNTSNWPPLLGVIAKPNSNPTYFDLQIVYNPPGISNPTIIEQFTNLLPATAAGVIDAGSSLVTVQGFAQSVDPGVSAYDLMNYDPTDAVPEITLAGTLNGITQTWTPQQNLLSNSPSDPAFVVETEYTGVSTLRFGDNTNGLTPDPGTAFTASYRIGNGTRGNVGAESLTMLSAADARITGCANPLPATGGVDPETNDQIRRRAPQQFLTQERAVTMADYEAAAESNLQVEQAVASPRWTGSWYTVFIAVEPENNGNQAGGNLTPALQKSVTSRVNSYRLAGEDIQLDSPEYVSLEIELQICVDPSYFNLDVQAALQQALGSQMLPNGTKGYFYPGNFTFGQTVYLSPIYAAARSIPGVKAVTALKFQIQGIDTDQYLSSGEIPLGSVQVARLDNNPSYPDHGQLTFDMEGGK